MIKAVVFDRDGLSVDSEPQLVIYFPGAIEAVDCPARSVRPDLRPALIAA